MQVLCLILLQSSLCWYSALKLDMLFASNAIFVTGLLGPGLQLTIKQVFTLSEQGSLIVTLNRKPFLLWVLNLSYTLSKYNWVCKFVQHFPG